MKKTFNLIAVSTLVTMLSGTAMAADTANQGSATVNFTGEIINAACNVTIDGVENGSVNLQKWPTSTFKAVGDTSIPQPFKIAVKDCLSGNYKFNFTGAADSTNTNLLKVSGAKGVGIAIDNDNKTPIKLNTTAGEDSAANMAIKSNEKEGELQLIAYYKSTNAIVTAGEANATVRVTLQQK